MAARSKISVHGPYVFAGGGTGGHLFPGLAVAEELRRRDPQSGVLFVGSGRSIEREIVAGTGYRHETLPGEPSAGGARRPLRFLWRNWRGYREAQRLLARVAPRAVVGLGGFASVPVVMAASSLGIPCLLLEQNIVPGRATRWLSRRADLLCTAFDGLGEKLPGRTRIEVTGNPVRGSIAELCPSGRSDTAGVSPAHGSETVENGARGISGPVRPLLLVLGGSQGAAAVNHLAGRAVAGLGPRLCGWDLVHQTGGEQHGRVRDFYRRQGLPVQTAPFIAGLPDYYRRTSVVIARAGATTLAELACAGLPAILVPHPRALDDHQRRNAEFYESRGAARIIEQGADLDQSAGRMAAELARLIDDRPTLHRMCKAMHRLARPEAARSVVDRLLDLAHHGGTGRRRCA